MSSLPPPPPYYPAVVPPPPPRPRRTATAVGALVAVAAFAAGVVVGRQNDDDQRAERSSETTAGVPNTTTPRTQTTGGAAPTVAPPATEAVGPGPPLPFTTLDQAVYPADGADLRALLDKFGFPDWWPMPDAIAPDSAPFPTVQEIRAKDSVLNPGRTDAAGGSDLSTKWLVDSADVAAAEATWVPKISAEMFDVQAGLANKDTTIDNGVTEVYYSFVVVGGGPGDSLALWITDAVDTSTSERVGTIINFSWSVWDYDERPSAVPIGAAPGKAFLGLAPASPKMTWNSTEVVATGGLNPYFTSTPDATLKATWNVEGDDFDAVIAFLSDPANFTGDLQLVSTGVFESDEFWVQPMGYQGLIGEYSILKPDPADDTYLYLEFRLDE